MTLIIVGMISAMVVGIAIGVVIGCVITIANAFEDKLDEVQAILDEIDRGDHEKP